MAEPKRKPRTKRIAFTAGRLGKLRPPQAGRALAYDSEVPGLAFELRATGGASWLFYKRVGTWVVKVKIGDGHAMPLDDARQAARKLAASAAGGLVPQRPGGRATLGDAWRRLDHLPGYRQAPQEIVGSR
jgi:hypothetical protein